MPILRDLATTNSLTDTAFEKDSMMKVRSGGIFRGLLLVILPLILAGFALHQGLAAQRHREQATLVQQLALTDPSQLAALARGSDVLVSGALEGADAGDSRLTIYDAYIGHRTPGRRAGQTITFTKWDREPALDAHPGFWLCLQEGCIPVLAGDYSLEGPLERVRPGANPNDEDPPEGTREYKGFRTGQFLTILGSVTGSTDGLSVRARLLYNGSPVDLAAYLDQCARQETVGRDIFGTLAGFSLLLSLVAFGWLAVQSHSVR